MAEAVAMKVVSIALSQSFSTAKSAITQLRKRIADLALNEKLRDELCRRIDQLKGILQQIEVTAHDTDDESILRGIEEVGNDFTKCLKTCDEIEKQKSLYKFWKVPSNKRVVNELDSLLIYSLEVLSFLLEVSNYQDNAKRRKDLGHIEDVIRNPRAGCYDLFSDEKLEKVENLSVKERSPGVLQVNWERAQTEFLGYELEYDQQNGAYFQIDRSLNGCLLDSTKIVFPSKFSYEIRMRAVNGAGPGEWSEWAVGKFTVLPSPPRKPLAIHVYPPTSVTMVVEKPPEELCVKPVTHYVVNYREVGDNKYTNRTFAISELEKLTSQGKKAYKINLDWNIDATSKPIYNVKISLRNADGDSLPCQDYIRTGTISPGKPEKLMVVCRTLHRIIIKWNKPKTNLHLVNHYEVHWGRNGNTTKVKETMRCYAVFKELEPGRRYTFILRSVNEKGYRSNFVEINVKTKSRAAKVAKRVASGFAAGVSLGASLPALVPQVNSVGTAAARRITMIDNRSREKFEHFLKQYPDTEEHCPNLNRPDGVEDDGMEAGEIDSETSQNFRIEDVQSVGEGSVCSSGSDSTSIDTHET